MAEGARIAQATGADIIDINMGCPARHVTNGYSGSALMRDLDHALTLIEATVGAVSVPVTLKMRLGWDERSHQCARARAPRRSRRRAMVTVHGRTRCQFYKGSADWAAVRAVKAGRVDPGRRQRRHRNVRGRRRGARARPAPTRSWSAAAAQGRPWLPGQLARYLASGRREAAPPLADAARAHRRSSTRRCCASRRRDRPAACAQASRLGARRRRRERRRSAELLKTHRQTVLTARRAARTCMRRPGRGLSTISRGHGAAA